MVIKCTNNKKFTISKDKLKTNCNFDSKLPLRHDYYNDANICFKTLNYMTQRMSGGLLFSGIVVLFTT